MSFLTQATFCLSFYPSDFLFAVPPRELGKQASNFLFSFSQMMRLPGPEKRVNRSNSGVWTFFLIVIINVRCIREKLRKEFIISNRADFALSSGNSSKNIPKPVQFAIFYMQTCCKEGFKPWISPNFFLRYPIWLDLLQMDPWRSNFFLFWAKVAKF